MKQLLYLLLVCLFTGISLHTQAQECNKGRVDCTGECGRMTDENGDGFCDFGALSEPETPNRPYLFVEITIATLALYMLSSMLSKMGKFKKITHRKIWNYLLLITFLVSALLGLWLVVLINYELDTEFFKSYLTWHVDFGIAMSVVGIIHFIWHWNYYFRKK